MNLLRNWVVMPLFIAFAFLFINPGTTILISNTSDFGYSNFVYDQPDQMNSNITNSLNIVILIIMYEQPIL